MVEGKEPRGKPRRRRSGAARAGEAGAGDAAEPLQEARDAAALSSSPPTRRPHVRRPPSRFAALDLGTNNCRLLIAAPKGREFRVVDAFSRIVRLGEGLSRTGALSRAAMDRTIDALKVCAEKIERRGVTHGRYIATQACRGASNGGAFLDRVREETGLVFEIISTEEEARLAVRGCAELVDAAAVGGVVFDIGGGSTELSWIRRSAGEGPNGIDVAAWLSMPIGVVSLSERYGGRDLDAGSYDEIVGSVRAELAAFGDPAGLKAAFADGSAHLLGTSGTVTSIAGVHLELPRYRRDLVDGLWLSRADVTDVAARLRRLNFQERADLACIGPERADLVVCGCAILEAVMLEWPAERVRVADRGLREGVLVGLMNEAGGR